MHEEICILNNMKRLLIALFLLISMAGFGSPASFAAEAGLNQGAPLPKIDSFRQFLLKKDFATLNSRIGALQKEYEDDFKKEILLTTALYDFEIANAKMQPLFDEWVATFPDDFVPLLCRGVYFLDGDQRRVAKVLS